MNDTPQQPADPAAQRQQALLGEVVRMLRATLPALLTDTPQARARRDRVALAMVVFLAPANLDEAELAAHYVNALAHAKDCLRQVAQHAAGPGIVGKLRGQAAGMGRTARSYHTLPMQVQAVRRKRQADPVSR